MRATTRKIRETLAPHYSSGEIDAMMRIIFEQLMGYTRVDMVLHSEDELPDIIKEKIEEILRRLTEREPLQYILGDAYFYGLHFAVDGRVLVPRPETERLVDMVTSEAEGSDLRVLDVGTGSGCIAISIARALHFPIVTATDISSDALDVARQNASRLRVKIDFKLEDILTVEPPVNSTYDIIVSNPPYVTMAEKSAMDRNVLDYEPHSALFVPDEDPLLYYKAIVRYAAKALKRGGGLYLEINPMYATGVENLLANADFVSIDTERDFAGKIRFAKGRRKRAEEF